MTRILLILCLVAAGCRNEDGSPALVLSGDVTGTARALDSTGPVPVRLDLSSDEEAILEVTEGGRAVRKFFTPGVGYAFDGSVKVFSLGRDRWGLVLEGLGFAKAFWFDSHKGGQELWNPEWNQGSTILAVDWDLRLLFVGNNNTDKELPEDFAVTLTLYDDKTQRRQTLETAEGTIEPQSWAPGKLRYRVWDRQGQSAQTKEFAYELRH